MPAFRFLVLSAWSDDNSQLSTSPSGDAILEAKTSWDIANQSHDLN